MLWKLLVDCDNMGMTMSMCYRYEDPEDFTYIISEAQSTKVFSDKFRKYHDIEPVIFSPKKVKSFDELVLEHELQSGPPIRFSNKVIDNEERERRYDKQIEELKKRVKICKGSSSAPLESKDPDKTVYTFHRFYSELPDIKIPEIGYVDLSYGWGTDPEHFYIEAFSEVEACQCLLSHVKGVNTGGLNYHIEVYNLDLKLLVDSDFESSSMEDI